MIATLPGEPAPCVRWWVAYVIDVSIRPYSITLLCANAMPGAKLLTDAAMTVPAKLLRRQLARLVVLLECMNSGRLFARLDNGQI
ncbi:hypothetical protein [Burkholderia dolosa]|uniref:hypothetical protein n=1 Tax=Burkholderia dolosa TaxID=152500 RepID=UPI0031FDF6A3